MIQGAVAPLPFIALLSDELHQEYTRQVFRVGGAEQMRRSGQTGVPHCDHLLVADERSVIGLTVDINGDGLPRGPRHGRRPASHYGVEVATEGGVGAGRR